MFFQARGRGKGWFEPGHTCEVCHQRPRGTAMGCPCNLRGR